MIAGGIGFVCLTLDLRRYFRGVFVSSDVSFVFLEWDGRARVFGGGGVVWSIGLW